MKENDDSNDVDDALCDLSEKLGHEYDVLVSKRDLVNPQLHMKYAEKYKQIRLLINEIK